MDLRLPAPPPRYTSNSQRARVSSESWGTTNLYCANCPSPSLNTHKANTPAKDYFCPRCDATFQLKCKANSFGREIVDSAYSQMKKAIEEDATPNIFAMEYDPDQWTITNLFLIPRFAYGLSAIKCRAPLSATAERHDWIGCTILLDRIPQQARIPIIVSGVSIPREIVRAQYRKVRPLSQLRPDMRGWTLDVYNCIQRFGKQAFTTKEVRELVPELQKLHPGNYHVEEKIRQQLQKLRDLHLVDFPARGQYRIR